MGQKITNEGKCPYCNSTRKGAWYRGLYPQDEELLEIHCNTCGAAWNPDLTPRTLPCEERLETLGVLQKVKELELPYVEGDKPEWYNSLNKA